MRKKRKNLLAVIWVVIAIAFGAAPRWAAAEAHRVVVAKSGGDYTSINAAIGAISPTAADPYVIDVMPGTYHEQPFLPSFVHLRGAGREVTTINAGSISGSSAVSIAIGAQNVEVSGFTVTATNCAAGFFIMNTTNVTITSNAVIGCADGIYVNGIGLDPAITAATLQWNNVSGSGSTIDINTAKTVIIGNNLTGGIKGSKFAPMGRRRSIGIRFQVLQGPASASTIQQRRR